MSVPPFGRQYGLIDGLGVTTNLGQLPDTTFDARLQSQQIGEILLEDYSQAPEGLSTYSVTKTVRNLDINTQRFTYEIVVDMAISATLPAPEPEPIVE